MDNNRLNFLVESKVPFLNGLLEPYGSVSYVHPDDITPQRVRDIDAMIVRTRTRCDATLLDGSRCTFIATATIGTDHIDLQWCAAHGITVANAPGCNAPAVAQYVFGVVAALADRPLHTYTLGVIGVGHVGSIVAQWGRSLGMRVLLCDPPRQRAEGGTWHTLADIAREADIISLHTPLSLSGADATFHLVNHTWLDSLQRRPLIINAARGPIVDTQALVRALDCGIARGAAIDCWEDEPCISPALLERAEVATPHIAGYSRQGKWRASQMALDALTEHFGLPSLHVPGLQSQPVPQAVTAAAVALSYNPLASDSPALKLHPDRFEQLRNEYILRDELF